MPLTRTRALRRIALGASIAGLAIGASGAAAVPGWTSIASIPGVQKAQSSASTLDGASVWVTQGSAHTVTVIDTASNAVARTVDLGAGRSVQYIVPDPTGRFMWVADYSGAPAKVHKVDTSTYAVVADYTIPDDNWGLALAPDSTGFYTASGSSSSSGRQVTYTNATTGAQTSIPMPDFGGHNFNPWVVMMAPDGGRVYVLGGKNDNTAGLRVIDTATNTIVNTFTLPPGSKPCGNYYSAAIDPAGTKIYNFDEYSGDVYAIDTATGSILSTIPTTAGGGDNWWCFQNLLTLSTTGGYAIVGSPSKQEVHVLDLTTLADVHTYTQAGGIGWNPNATTLLPNMSRVYVSNFFANGSYTPPGSVSVLGFGEPYAPSAPLNVALTPADGALAVSYGTPDDDGGSPITGYEYSLDSGLTWVSAGTTGTSFTIRGLTNGTTYSVLVRATNAIGAGLRSAAVSGTAGSAPSPQPAGTSATPAANSQAAAEANPKITIPAAVVTRGRTLTSTVNPSAAGTVRVTATLAGRTACTVTKTATTAGRMTVTCTLNARTRAVIRKKGVTLKVTTLLTDAKGKTATASRNVRVARYVVRVPVTG